MPVAQRQVARSPRVIRVTFIPYTRRIYKRTLLDGYRALKIFAFSPGCACLVCDFCSSGRVLPAASFRFRVAPDTLAVRLTVPTIRVRRGLAPPSHKSATIADLMVLAHHAPCRAHEIKKGLLPQASLLCADYARRTDFKMPMGFIVAWATLVRFRGARILNGTAVKCKRAHVFIMIHASAAFF